MYKCIRLLEKCKHEVATPNLIHPSLGPKQIVQIRRQFAKMFESSLNLKQILCHCVGNAPLHDPIKLRWIK